METGKVYFATVYYPGYSTKHKYTHMRFLSDFNDFLATCTEGIQLITGDFNIHYEDQNRPETKKFLNILHQQWCIFQFGVPRQEFLKIDVV